MDPDLIIFDGGILYALKRFILLMVLPIILLGWGWLSEKFSDIRFCTYLLLIGSMFTLLPLFMGYSLNFTEGYDRNNLPSFLEELSSTFKYYGALVAGISASAPILLDTLMDLIYRSSKPAFNNYIPSREIFLIIVVPDIFILIYLLPYKHFDWLTGIVAIRDTLFNYAFLLNLYRLEPKIWSKNSLLIVAFSAMIGNIALVASQMKIDGYTEYVMDYLSKAVLGFAHLVLGRVYWKWFKYLRSVKDKQIQGKVQFCNIYAMVYAIFFIADFSGAFVPATDPAWNYLIGVEYLTMYTYVTGACSLLLTVMTTRLSRQETLEIKRMFIRYMSHEMRTPLNTVCLGLKLLEKDLKERKYDECITTTTDIRVSTDIVLSILNDMLTYDKVENKSLSLDKTSFPPWPLIRDTVNAMNIQALELGLDIQYDNFSALKETLSNCTVYGDTFKLSQVIRNLMSNALKFTPTGHCIRLAVDVKENNSIRSPIIRRRGRCNLLDRQPSAVISMLNSHALCAHVLQFHVIDEGVGISLENQKRLFTQEIQFSPGTLQKGGGTGIGLLISQGIMEAHGGSLSVHSDGEGHGCTFTMKIPVSYDPEKQFNQSIGSSVAFRGFSRDSKDNDCGSYENTTVTMSLRKESHSVRFQALVGNSSPPKSTKLNGLNGLIMRSPTPDSCRRSSYVVPFNSSSKALIVDDSDLTRKMMKRTFQRRYDTCLEASDGEEAVALVKLAMEQGEVFDVILMDYQMPNMDGPTATKLIREMGYEGLITGVTGNIVPADVNTFIEHGADMVFSKPLDVEAFEQSLNNRLSRLAELM